MNKKLYPIIRTAIFVVLGILVLIFNEGLMKDEGAYLNYLVGGVTFIYAVDALVSLIIKKEIKEEPIKLFNAVINLLITIILLFLLKDNVLKLTIVCVIWSLWSIMREGEEIYEKVVEEIKTPITALINLVESIVVIVFSILLIINPGEHHAHSHVILLGIELVLEVIWPLLVKLEEKIFDKKEKEID